MGAARHARQRCRMGSRPVHDGLLWPGGEGLADNPLCVRPRGFPRVVRGGSWDDDPEMLRSAARSGSSDAWSKQDPQIPKSIWYHTDALQVGFRIVRPLAEPSEAEREPSGKPPAECRPQEGTLRNVESNERPGDSPKTSRRGFIMRSSLLVAGGAVGGPLRRRERLMPSAATCRSA